MAGDPNVVECAYVASNLITDVPFFASQLRLGPGGIEGGRGMGTQALERPKNLQLSSAVQPAEFLPLPKLSGMEADNFEAMKVELQASINKGINWFNRT